MRTRRISCRVTEDEYAMIEAYAKAVDRDLAGLVRHAVFSMLRRDRRRVRVTYHALLESED